MLTNLSLVLVTFAAIHVDVSTLEGVSTSGHIVSLDSESLVLTANGTNTTFATSGLMGVVPKPGTAGERR